MSGAKAAGIPVGQTGGNREYNVQLTLDGWVTSRHISGRIGQHAVQPSMLYVNVAKNKFKRLVNFPFSYFNLE